MKNLIIKSDAFNHLTNSKLFKSNHIFSSVTSDNDQLPTLNLVVYLILLLLILPVITALLMIYFKIF